MSGMEGGEIRKLVALEDRHWWYRERRAVLARLIKKVERRSGLALDVGAAGGGNTRVLRDAGWRAVAVEYGLDGAEVAHERGLSVIRGDARSLPLASAQADLVVSFDVLEHITEDDEAAAEMRRVLRPGGTAIIAVPCDPKLWSPHDVALSHVRRYTRPGLVGVMEKAGFDVQRVWSWNVLLRPVAAWRRKNVTSGCDLDNLSPLVNAGLTSIVTLERYLPVKSLPGVSLMLLAHRPR
jgi:SAM-dependent methyltransferase